MAGQQRLHVWPIGEWHHGMSHMKYYSMGTPEASLSEGGDFSRVMGIIMTVMTCRNLEVF